LDGVAEGRHRAVSGRPPTIRVEDVVEGATALAARVGLEGVTMGQVANELGVTTTALYHYVPSKQALIDLVVDAALDRVPVPPPDAGAWDERLRIFEAAVRAELRRIPGSGLQLVTHSEIRPAEQRLIDIGLEIFAETGAEERQVRLAFTTLLAYMIGQLWLDDLGGGKRTSELEALQDATGSVAFTSNDLFAYGIDTVLAGLRARLDKA
jgi:TetR/AcrR family transcriptional regulator, tetracycline repressor protein